MRLLLQKVSLSQVLNKIVAFIPSRNTSDHLVRLLWTDEGLSISVTLPEATIQTILTDVAVTNIQENNNHFWVSGRLLLDIVNKAGSDTLRLDFDSTNNKLVATTDDSQWSIPLTKALVRLPERGELVTQLLASELTSALKAVSYAVGSDPSRAYLMLIDIVGGRARATDGQSYAEKTIENTDLNLSVFYSMITPLISWLSSSTDQEVSLYQTATDFTFVIENNVVSLAKRNLDFPDLDRLYIKALKAQASSVLLVDRKTLISSLNRVKLVVEKDSPIVELCIEGQSMSLRCSKKTGAEAITHVPIKWGAATRTAHFDIAALLDLLRSTSEDMIELRFGPDIRTRKSPIVLQGNSTWSMLTQMNV